MEERRVPAVRPEFVLFGDSITQQGFVPSGWAALLAAKYCRTADITLRGYSGYTSRWALHLLPALFPPSRAAPALVTVCLGANDACLPPPLRGCPPQLSRQHVPQREYCDNLRQIIKSIRACGDGSARVLLLTPPPVDDGAWFSELQAEHDLPAHAESNRTLEAAKEYAACCLNVGAMEGVPVVDLCADFLQQPNWREMFSDGLHPNSAGGALIFSSVSAAIDKAYPELEPASFGKEALSLLPMDFPDHKSLDTADLAGCIRRHRQNHSSSAVHQPRFSGMSQTVEPEQDEDATGACTDSLTAQ
ncbi:hypothetical protein AB1Y20_014417 [Prymnesium parvum]|uniref:SGNH hydrolase-type esterase domain-containing protein n=1 Tax=Prymnesium parvum TaxID=97485 RepID=A0AB34IDM0_PRYPA